MNEVRTDQPPLLNVGAGYIRGRTGLKGKREMYQLKIFTAATPLEVEDLVNCWLKQRSEVSIVRLTQATQ